MPATVFNCHDNSLTDEVFEMCGKQIGKYFEDWHTSKKETGPFAHIQCTAQVSCYTKYDINSREKLDVQRRVVILFNPQEEELEIYELFPQDILSELRLEFRLRKNKGHYFVFKGLTGNYGQVHFYRKTEYGERTVSRYFGVA